MVQIPARIPLLKPFTVLLGVAFFIWLALEGDLRYVLTLGCLAVAVGWGQTLQRLIGGRQLRLWRFLALMVASGAVAGLVTNLVVLILMAVKTGLHGHGPEFNQTEIEWVMAQLAPWLFIATLIGLGVGLIIGSTTVPVQQREESGHELR